MNDVKNRLLQVINENPGLMAKEIAEIIGVYTELINHHLNQLAAKQIVTRYSKRREVNKIVKNYYHYKINEEYKEIVLAYEEKPKKEFDEITPFMQRLLGINTHNVPYNKGKVYTEKTFDEIQKNYKEWNPSKPKSKKTYVTGNTLSWL